MCQKVRYNTAANFYGNDRLPMSQENKKNIKWEGKILHDKMGLKGVPCKILYAIGMGDLMCNEISSNQQEGRMPH